MALLNDGVLAAGLIALLAVLTWGAVSDVTRYRIPNHVCGLVAGLYVLALASLPVSTWLGGVGIAAAVLAGGVLLFARGLVGGGDVKFAAAIALWAGPARFDDFLLVTAASSVVLSLAILSPARRWLPHPPQEVSAEFRRPVPYGAPLALGGAWVALLHLSAIQ